MTGLSLLEVLALVPDPRSRRGRSYPLSAGLALLVLGMLLGRRSLSAIARFVPDYGGDLALLLGFPRRKTPCVATLSSILQRLDVPAFEQQVGAWIQQFADENPPDDDPPDHPLTDPPPDLLAVHIDGKTLRGSRIPEADLPGVHLLSAFAPLVQGVLAQVRVDAKTNEHKSALQLLKLLPQRPGGYLFTGDAMFCQKEVCEAIAERGGHYLFVVKDNQPSLATDIEGGLSFEATARTLSLYPSR